MKNDKKSMGSIKEKHSVEYVTLKEYVDKMIEGIKEILELKIKNTEIQLNYHLVRLFHVFFLVTYSYYFIFNTNQNNYLLYKQYNVPILP